MRDEPMHRGTTDAGHPDADDGVVVEWAPFRLADGVDEGALLEASAALQRDFLRHQPGFLRRELLRAAGGGWVDLVFWASQDAADAVVPAIAASPACHAYFRLMVGADPADPAAGVQHLRRVRVYLHTDGTPVAPRHAVDHHRVHEHALPHAG